MTCYGPECDRPVQAVGLCNAHHHQMSRGVELTPLRDRRKDALLEDAEWLARSGVTWEEANRRLGYAPASLGGRSGLYCALLRYRRLDLWRRFRGVAA